MTDLVDPAQYNVREFVEVAKVPQTVKNVLCIINNHSFYSTTQDFLP